ncbi:MAG TPA: ArsI/CadI family heavy metal resistance metalloenzyme [Candidatus Dormibacteraeota bacterium]|nr:ArsI/CadI family heavy metal resistance metalloenzyme [Candidatus Dormibacteraeota bacterium]
MRPHLSLDVRNVPASVEFYRKIFSVAPQKQVADYAKFDLKEPALNLSLVSSTGRISSVDHLGIEVESIDEVAVWKQRLHEQGILEKVEQNVACCFARQDKLWFSDPDGNAWEIFTVHEQLDVTGPLANTGCCLPKSQGIAAPATGSHTSDTLKGKAGKKRAYSRSSAQSILVLLLILAAPFAWADGGRLAKENRSADAPVVFVAHDYGFTGPDRLPAGLIIVQILNQGHDLHHVQLVELLQGKTAVDFQAAMKAAPDRLPTWVKLVGGPNAVIPGEQSTSTVQLTAGNYALLCLIPDRNGVPHMALGMVKALTVTPAMHAALSEPKVDLTITQSDFAFALSQPMTPGSHSIEVMNAGEQPHEVVVVKLAPGASAKDFGAAFEPGASGLPPGQPVGGLTGLERGGRAFFTGHFESGHYGLICFFPDLKTGAPHFTKGMVLDFDVK